MQIVDYHVHSAWSPDSRMSVRKALNYCRENHVKEIVFTEHLDMGDPGQIPYLDLSSYLVDIEASKLEYPDIIIGCGLELGMHPGNIKATETYIHPYEWDFLIMSVHQYENIGFCDPMLLQRFEKQEILDKYWNAWFYNVEHFKDFHVLGHLDYLLRYQPISIEEFEVWTEPKDAMLKRLIERGQGIEINAKGIKSLGRPHPSLNILRRYKALGGEIVTLGSDAHSVSNIARHFDTISQYLKEAGFNYFARRDFEKKEFYFEKLCIENYAGVNSVNKSFLME